MPPVMRRPALNRVPPQLPPQFLKSYVLLSPRDTTVVQACKDAGCLMWAHGWESVIDERTARGREQAQWIRYRSGREFRELAGSESGITVFRFPAFQRCFANHKTRPAIGLVRGGDWRGNPRGERRVHKTLADWQEDSAIHQGRLVEAIRVGHFGDLRPRPVRGR